MWAGIVQILRDLRPHQGGDAVRVQRFHRFGKPDHHTGRGTHSVVALLALFGIFFLNSFHRGCSICQTRAMTKYTWGITLQTQHVVSPPSVLSLETEGLPTDFRGAEQSSTPFHPRITFLISSCCTRLAFPWCYFSHFAPSQTKKFYKLVKEAAKSKIARRGVKEVRKLWSTKGKFRTYFPGMPIAPRM